MLHYLIQNGKVLLVLCVLIVSAVDMYAQMDSIGYAQNSDTLVFFSSDLRAFLEEEGLLSTVKYEDMSIFDEFRKETKLLEKKMKTGLNPRRNTVLMNDNYYYRGDSSYLYPNDVVYSTLRMKTKLTPLGIPLTVGGNITAVNGIISRTFSNFSISFDTKSALNTLGRKYLPKLGTKVSFIDLLKQTVGLSSTESKLLKDELKTEAYQKIIANAKYNLVKDSLFQKRSELVSKRDSLVGEISCEYEVQVDEVQKKLEGLQKFENKYYDLWQGKGARLNQLNELKSRIASFRKKMKAYSDSEKLKAHFLEKGKLKQLQTKEKLAVLLKGASIGLVTFNDREYTYKNLSVLGGLVEYQGKNVYTSLGYGKHNLSRNLSIFSDHFIANRYSGNSFLFIKAGLGQISSDHVQITYLKSTKKGNLSPVGIINPNNNFVIATSIRQMLIGRSAVITDVAISKQDIQPIDIHAVSVNRGKDNMAFSMKSELMLLNNKVRFDVGYFQIGPNFYTSGNPFLLTNRKGVLGEVESRFWQNRLSVKARIDYAVAKVSETANTLPFKRVNFSGQGKLMITRKHNIFFRYAPSRSYRSLGAGTFQANNYFYMVQSNSLIDLDRGRKVITVVSLTNLQSNVDAVDTTFSLDNQYLLMQQSYVFGKRAITLTGMMSSQDYFHLPIKDYQGKFEFSHTLKKISYSVGSSFEKRRWDGIQRVGLVSGVKYNFLKTYTLSIQSLLSQALSPLARESVTLKGQVSFIGKF